ncbi:hypothetical protein WA538_001216, partial [Blastocystis sp. DL]
MYRWEFGEESSKKVKVYPMLWSTHWMFLQSIAEIIGRENVHVGGKITDVDIARLCGESSIVISEDSDFLLMPIRGVLPIRGILSRDFKPVYYSLSRLPPEELNAVRFACYQKGNDYFGSSLATDFNRVRNTPRYKSFLAFYSSVRNYPTDPSRFLVSSLEESRRLHLDAGMRAVLAMDLFVTSD